MMRASRTVEWMRALILCGLCAASAVAQDTERERPKAWNDLMHGGRFMDRFLPSPVRTKLSSDCWGVDAVKPRDMGIGIEEPEWSYWGGNIVKVSDNEYQLYVCRWREDHPKGHMAWHGSEVARAVAPNAWGPYKAVEVIGQGHNPEIYRAKDGSYVLYAIRRYYHSPTPTGPWTEKKYEFKPRGRRIIEGLSNLSFAPREDGSVLMVCRGGGIWVSETGFGPWQQISNRRAYPPVEGRFEDPVIWKTDVQYHMIVNDWLGRIAWYLRSKDGHAWKVEPGEAYLPGIDVYEDGTKVDWYKYERIKVLQDEHGRAYQAMFAVIAYSKWEDKASDIHSSKNINMPLTVGRLIAVLNDKAIGPGTKTIRLKVSAEPGFNPHKDMAIASLRFGASDEVNFGRGCKVVDSKRDGKDLILTFDGKGNGFTADSFAGKLLGKASNGKLLFGYSRLPGVSYGEAMLSADMPKLKLEKGKLAFSVDVKNFGLSASQPQKVSVLVSSGDQKQRLSLELPKLATYEATTLSASVPCKLDPALKCGAKLTVPSQKTPLYESEQHKKSPQLKINTGKVR